MLQSEIPRPLNTRDNQTARGKDKSISNINQCNLASSGRSSSATSSPVYANTLEKQDSYLKAHLIKIIENFKEDINNSLKEIQENIDKQVKELKKWSKT
jgi:CRISPR/Cas system endoribonuclease Cas6 (RAMP superfamily)